MEKKSLYAPVSIGSLNLSGNLFLAPIAGYSDYAFRSLCVKHGADFSYTEMVSAEGLVRDSRKTKRLLKKALNESRYGVQIFGADSKSMAEAARIVIGETGAECIDINAGCPVLKIVKTGAGSGLAKNLRVFFDVVSAVVNVCEVHNTPVSVKIRLGWTSAEMYYAQVARAAFDAGVSAITLHARTRAQGYTGFAAHEHVTHLVSLAKPYGVPVFASGDIFSPEDAKRILESTACAGVMFARGAMGNPFIFNQTKDYLQKGMYVATSIEMKLRTALSELLLLSESLSEERACKEMRKRFLAYTKGLPASTELRKALSQASLIAEYQAIVNEYLEVYDNITVRTL